MFFVSDQSVFTLNAKTGFFPAHFRLRVGVLMAVRARACVVVRWRVRVHLFVVIVPCIFYCCHGGNSIIICGMAKSGILSALLNSSLLLWRFSCRLYVSVLVVDVVFTLLLSSLSALCWLVYL